MCTVTKAFSYCVCDWHPGYFYVAVMGLIGPQWQGAGQHGVEFEEAAGHILPPAGREREMNTQVQSALSLLFIAGSGPKDAAAHI